MKERYYKGIIKALPVLIIVIFACMIASAKQQRDVKRDAAKADYYFLEALRQRAQGNNDAYFALIEEAYLLNPADKYLAMQEGTRRLSMFTEADTTRERIDEALALIRDYVNETPTDLYAGQILASASRILGRPDEAIATWLTLYKSDPRSEIGINYVDALLSMPDSANVAKALAVLDTIEVVEGIVPDISMRRMRLYEAQNDTIKIKEEARKLLNSSPNDVSYLVFAGRLYTGLGEQDSALVFFNRAVELEPDNGSTYYNRALYYNQIGDSLAYDNEVNQVMQLADLDIEPKLDILRDYVIQLYQDSTQHQRINNIFQTLIDLNPHEPMVRQLYADYLVAIKNYLGAAEQKGYELDMNPSNKDGWLMLTSLYFQVDDNAKARSAALRGAHYFPDEAKLYEMAAVADMQSENLDSALTLLDKAVEVADQNDVEHMSTIYAQIGDVYYQREQLDSVAVYYDKALLYNPTNLLALNNYAYYISCEDNGDLDRALEMIEKVMTYETDNPTSLDTYAWVLFRRKNYEKARTIIDKAVELTEEPSADIFDHAGDIYFMDGEPAKALEFWEKALKLDPDNKLLKKKVKHKTFFYE